MCYPIPLRLNSRNPIPLISRLTESGTVTILLFPYSTTLNPVSSQSRAALRSSPCSHIDDVSLVYIANCCGCDVSPLQNSSRACSAWLAIRSEALGFGMPNVLFDHVAIGKRKKLGIIHSAMLVSPASILVMNVDPFTTAQVIDARLKRS